ncbi:bifunctional pyridoxamine 5'-phosphate oxidase family protein/GNAT family N-acetyltransferase [Dactylosporangium sp. NPDC051541]|uniref:bifunctional pyridoxamine 5'-phosphate oxidase family protein/GNAT family N-acetyltransferase n=1 Tax=Dactylosporangium sp. NPDC051541 TaxID=3363977 RepID=UPI0037B2811F
MYCHIHRFVLVQKESRVETYQRTARSTPRRLPERASYDAELVHAVLDEAYVCHVSYVADGEPRVLPTLHARVGETLYLHGSTGSRAMLAARDDGLPVCVAVTIIDGLVLAKSQFHHSANYRSVIVHGVARPVADEDERARAFAALVDKVAPGRDADSRRPSRRESAQTAVLALPLAEVSAKLRAGGPSDDPEDADLPHWAGVVPLQLTRGLAAPAEDQAVPLPDYLRLQRGPWRDAVTLRGRHVVLEPLDRSHTPELFAALDDAEVWAHLTSPRPTSVADLAAIVTAALSDPDRVAFVQRETETGRIVGSTSFYAPNPSQRSIAIGYTMVGRPWWRTAINTESKLLMLRYAFDTLGALRVEWHTDVRNQRSQRAIERLGAQREGILRRHRQRADGSQRDTVLYSMINDEWPAARDRLAAALDTSGVTA